MKIKLENGRTMHVIVEQDDYGYLVKHAFLGIHGVGSTANAAIQEFMEMLHDHYEDYSADRARLSDYMLCELDFLECLFA